MGVSERAVSQVVELHAQGVLDDNEVASILTRWVIKGDNVEDLLERITPEVRKIWKEFARDLPESVENHLEYQGPSYTKLDQPRFDLVRAWGAED